MVEDLEVCDNFGIQIFGLDLYVKIIFVFVNMIFFSFFNYHCRKPLVRILYLAKWQVIATVKNWKRPVQSSKASATASLVALWDPLATRKSVSRPWEVMQTKRSTPSVRKLVKSAVSFLLDFVDKIFLSSKKMLFKFSWNFNEINIFYAM